MVLVGKVPSLFLTKKKINFPSFHINQEKFQSHGLVSYRTWKFSASVERFLKAGSMKNPVVTLFNQHPFPDCEPWGFGLHRPGK